MTLDAAKLKAAAPYQSRFSRLWERFDEASHGNAEHMRDILEVTLDALGTAERHIFKADRETLELISALEAMAAAHMNLQLLADVYRQAYEEARARTVTVELPRGYVGPYGSLVYDADAVDAALELAGINLETGGE